LYTAHEIAQIMPLVNRDNTYEQFLSANKWVLQYLPNAYRSIQFEGKKIKKAQSIFRMLEYIAKKVQVLYMKRKITREYISDTMLAFHPVDYRTRVLQEYEKRVKKYAV
ncbi:MAG: hypothetical protein ACHQHP_06090, partial [Bacteroidia bacterium]